MSDFTFATVIITASDQAAAQASIGAGFFNAGLSADGKLPATHYLSSGAFDNVELNLIVNSATWPRKVYFGNDSNEALTAELLIPVVAAE